MSLSEPPDRAPFNGWLFQRFLRFALLMCVGCALGGLLVVWAWGPALELELGLGYWALLAGLAASVVAGIAALFPGASSRAPRADSALFLRAAFSLAVLSQLVLWGLFPSHREPYVAACLGLAAGAYALGVTLTSRVPVSCARWVQAMDLGVFGAALGGCACELLLRFVAVLFHPALLAETSNVSEWLASSRLQPGSVRFGFPVNAHGFYDHDLPTERSGTLVGVIGDSFSVGTVAHSLHYTSVAEAELPDTEFYNVGVPGADPRHYLELLREDVLPLEPQVIVIALFIGNDLEFGVTAEEGPTSPFQWIGDRRQSFLVRFVQRLRRLSRERSHAEGEETRPGASQEDELGTLVPPAGVPAAFPWFADPALESATFSSEGFQKIERERAQALTRPSEGYACFPWLEELQNAAGGLPLLLLLIPDEFQVEEDVWAAASAGLEGPLDRDQPQALVARFCQAHRLAFLDLLPALRAVAPLADGRRHLYALRDTHWNARGNAVAGQELARAIRALLGR